MTERPDEPTEPLPPVSPSYDPGNPYGAPEPTQPLPGWTPYAPPHSGYAVPQQPVYFAAGHQGANTAMGLGIASLVCAAATPFVCITLPGIFCGPFAIALAVKAQREIRAEPGRFNNAGSATTGLVTGIIGTVLGVAMIGLVVLVFGFVLGIDDVS